MTTTYPGTIDSFDTHVDSVDDVMAADVNDLGDAVVEIEKAIGSEGNQGLCEGRLTLLTGNPITLANQAAKTTVYFAPYKGNRISLYDGAAGWDTLNFAEASVAVPATTTTPFDVFAYNNSGTIALEALSWTNDTTRATAISLQDGVYVKTGATTRRYLGTCRTTGVSGQTEDSYANRFVWNYYNRIRLYGNTEEATLHTYTTASYRSWNNDATVRIGLVIGVAETHLLATLNAAINQQAGEGTGYVNAGYDSTSVASFWGAISNALTGFGVVNFASSVELIAPVVGYHYLQIIEYGAATSPDFVSAHLVAEWEG